MVHRTATADDKKLQSSLKKLAVNNIAGIEEVDQLLSSLPPLISFCPVQRELRIRSCFAGEYD